MDKPIVYLVCGVPGAGKSWVCEQLDKQAIYIAYDRTSKEQALGKMLKADRPVIYDRPVLISSFIKHNSSKLDIRPIFILGDFLRVKQQLKDRGGKITKNLYYRWKRMQFLANRLGIMSGSSEEVLSFLKKELSFSVKYLIYKATSPSGKIYIGKTNNLAARIAGHKHDALTRNKPWSFSNAIRKYGIDKVQFEVLQDDIYSFFQINALEKKFIKEHDTLNPNKGYNLTIGGDGAQLISDVLDKKSKALKSFYSTSDGLKVRQILSAKTTLWSQTPAGKKALAKSKKSRSSKESRQLTSFLNKERYKSQDAKNFLSQKMKEVYTSSSLREDISVKTKLAKARVFDVINASGVIVGTWSNIVDCAKELKIQQAGISAALNGHRVTYKNLKFIWRKNVI